MTREAFQIDTRRAREQNEVVGLSRLKKNARGLREERSDWEGLITSE
jgi:hypothetical protein